ncbi:MAG: hypothetical protein QHJ73_10815, partial [Armatimonadota bacterium]|nr:hypothetical protein [Armatimonadota bacterium]
LEAHLHTCAACRAEEEVFGRVLSLVNSVPQVPPPEGLWERIERNIRSDVSVVPVRRSAALPALVAAAAALAGIGLYLASPSPQPVPTLTPESIAYIRSHALVNGGRPLADRVGIVSFVTAAGRYPQEGGGGW